MVADKVKFERFTNSLYGQANIKFDEIVKKSKIKAEKIVENAEIEAKDMAEEKIKKEKNNVNVKYTNLLSVATLDAKKELLSYRKSLTEKLFSDVENELMTFVNSDEYFDYLADKITKNIKNNECKLAVSSKDFSRKQAISSLFKEQKLELFEDKSIKIGGVKIIDKNVTYDFTLDTKLEDKIAEFTQNYAHKMQISL